MATTVPVGTKFNGTRVAVGTKYPAGYPTAPDTTGLRIWLKADAGVASSSGSITTWTDQQSSIVFTASGAGPAPALVSSSLNGLPVVRMNNTGGTNQTCYFAGTIDPRTWTGITVIYVIRTAASGTIPVYNSTVAFHQAGVDWWSFNAGTDATQGVGWAGTDGSKGLGAYSPALGNAKVVYQAYQFDKTTAWTMTGAFSGTTADTSGGFPTSSTTAMWIGSVDFAGGQSTSDLCEILVYDRSIAAGALVTDRSYMTGRWGA